MRSRDTLRRWPGEGAAAQETLGGGRAGAQARARERPAAAARAQPERRAGPGPRPGNSPERRIVPKRP